MRPVITVTSIPCTSAAFAELSAEILRAGKALRFQARGSSMAPLVRDGDVLLVRPAEPVSLRVGDVVLCGIGDNQPGRMVAHRVLERWDGPDGARFMVQGDQVARTDGVIPAARVYGRVVAIERAGAHIDMDRPVVRWLGRLAVLRSRRNLGRGRWLWPARRLVKKLPGLSRYL